MKLFSIIYISVFFLTCIINLHAQKLEKPTTCESNSAYLDALLRNINEEDVIIVISRLGKTEKNSNLNKRRLYNVKAYLIDYMKSSILSRNPDNIILTVGDKTNGLGTIEIYHRGKLFSKFYLSNEGDLYIGECAVDLELYKNACDIKAQKVFYPCKK